VIIQTSATGRRTGSEKYLGSCARGYGVEGLSLPQVSPLFGTIYDAVVLLAHALNHSENHGTGPPGAHLGNHIGALDVAGFDQRIRTDKKGRRLARYVILDTDGQGNHLVPTHILDTDTWQVQPLGKTMHFPGGAPPACDSSCWFDPTTLCMTGNSSSTCPPIHLSLHPSIHLLIPPPATYPSIHTSTHPSIHPSNLY
jgi:guanylate cyclase 2D/E/F